MLALLAGARLAGAAEELPVDRGREAALLEAAGGGFELMRTPHFVVAHHSDAAIVTPFVSRVEQTYNLIYRFCELNRIKTRRPPHRLEVIFFDKRAEFDAYSKRIGFSPEGAYGVYSEESNRSAFFNVHSDPELLQIHADIAAARASLEKLTASLREVRGEAARIEITYSDGRTVRLSRAQAQKEVSKSREKLAALDGQRVAYAERINRTVVQHEVAHQVFFNAGVHVRGAVNPKWLVEGLACLFETPPDKSSSGSGVFAINQLRLQDFRSAVAGERPGGSRLTGQEFIDAIASGPFTRPERLVSRSDVFNARGDRGAANYAMTWALAHYLQRQRPTALAAYIQEVAGRPAGSAPEPDEELKLFVKHFGPLDTAFLKRWGDYILGLQARSQSASRNP